MTPDDLQRVARLEERDAVQNARLEKIEAKLDQLLKAANMGQGAWLVLLKLGGFVVAVVGIVAAVVTVAEKLISLLKH